MYQFLVAVYVTLHSLIVRWFQNVGENHVPHSIPGTGTRHSRTLSPEQNRERSVKNEMKDEKYNVWSWVTNAFIVW